MVLCLELHQNDFCKFHLHKMTDCVTVDILWERKNLSDRLCDCWRNHLFSFLYSYSFHNKNTWKTDKGRRMSACYCVCVTSIYVWCWVGEEAWGCCLQRILSTESLLFFHLCVQSADVFLHFSIFLILYPSIVWYASHHTTCMLNSVSLSIFYLHKCWVFVMIISKHCWKLTERHKYACSLFLCTCVRVCGSWIYPLCTGR